MDGELILAAGFVVLGWAVVALLGALERRVSPGRFAEPVAAAPRWALPALVGVALATALLRTPFAAGRALRNVDEAQYAALAAFLDHTGEGFFTLFARLHWLVYRLGSLEAPFAAADAITSFVVGATGLLLGATLLRAGRSPWAAALTPALYALGVLRHEGLTSNSELWVNACLAAWAFVRLRGAAVALDARGRALAGLWLGVAGLMKEQALPYALLVPALEALDLREGWRVAARRTAHGLAGLLVPWALWCLLLLREGQLLPVVGDLLGLGAAAGEPIAGQGDDGAGWLAPLLLLAGLAPVWKGPVGLLGLISLARVACEPRAATAPERRPEVGLSLLAAGGLAAASIGLRFFPHYLMLPVVGLAPLAALQLVRAVDAARRASAAARAHGLVVVALAAFTAIDEARLLADVPGFAAGHGQDAAAQQARLERVGRRVSARVPAGQPIFVWGWRPELYLAAGRPPSTRFQAGTAVLVGERLYDDLERWPPAAVVMVGDLGIGWRPPDEGGDPYALDRHPRFADWLAAHGFDVADRIEGCWILMPRGR